MTASKSIRALTILILLFLSQAKAEEQFKMIEYVDPNVTTFPDTGQDLNPPGLVTGARYEYQVKADGTDESFSGEGTPTAIVVLVRGYGNRDPNYWHNYADYLRKDGYTVWDATGYLNGSKGVRENAVMLDLYLSRQLKDYADKKGARPHRLFILAHSMGGVISRLYMLYASLHPSPDHLPVDTLVMVSPANCGSWMANYLKAHPWIGGIPFLPLPKAGWSATDDMMVESVAGIYNRLCPWLPGHTLVSIAGTTWVPGYALLWGLIQTAERDWAGDAADMVNDGIITKLSSWGVASPAVVNYMAQTYPGMQAFDAFLDLEQARFFSAALQKKLDGPPVLARMGIV